MPHEVGILGWAVACILAAGWIWTAIKLSEARRAYLQSQAQVDEATTSAKKLKGELTEAEAILGRRERDAQARIQHANEAFARALLPVESALSRAQEVEFADVAATRAGIVMVHRLMEQALVDAHMTPIRPTPGDRFDPQVHESIGMDPDSVSPEEGGVLVVTEVGRNGWLLHDRLMKAAEVVVRRDAEVSDVEEDAPLVEEAEAEEAESEAETEPEEVETEETEVAG